MLAALFSTYVVACDYEIGLGYGGAQQSTDVYRLGVKRHFNSTWLESNTGELKWLFEMAYNRWGMKQGHINAYSLSPVFNYIFNTKNQAIKPYLEAGIGLAYIDSQRVGTRELSTDFQFEDRLGIGLIIRQFIDVNLRYIHYSNASIKKPNNGLM